jgi:hypothetical protein
LVSGYQLVDDKRGVVEREVEGGASGGAQGEEFERCGVIGGR